MFADGTFQKRAATFIDPLVQEMTDLGLTAEVSAIDHVCYRVADLATYERRKVELSGIAVLLSEAFVNGRPIASYRLHSPIRLASGQVVAIIELPAPKSGATYAEGFEHIEAVTRAPLTSLIDRFPGLKFDLRNQNAAVNADIAVRLKQGLVKFHASPLDVVIAEEQAALRRRTERRVVVFDFDDTLTASRLPFLQAFHRALERYRGEPIEFEMVKDRQKSTFPEFFANLGITDPTVMTAILRLFPEEWAAVAEQCSIPIGITSLISCLRSEGVEMHVWTARDHESTESYLASTGLRAYFSSVVGFDALHPSKPQPSPSLRAACSGARGVVIGDTNTDRMAAANLGFDFVQAAWIHRHDLQVAAEDCCATPLTALTRTLALLDRPV